MRYGFSRGTKRRNPKHAKSCRKFASSTRIFTFLAALSIVVDLFHNKHYYESSIGKTRMGFTQEINDELIRPISKHSSNATAAKIPRTLWFTYSHNILLTGEPRHFYDNIQKTIASYRAAWKNNCVKVNFLTNDACLDLLKRVEPRLVDAFRYETRGMYKADICRAAALYESGGYYFDVDVEVIAPLILDNEGDQTVNQNISFVTARSGWNRETVFQAILASAPRHVILNETLHKMVQHYDRALIRHSVERSPPEIDFEYEKQLEQQNGGRWLMGTNTMGEALRNVTLDGTLFLQEEHLRQYKVMHGQEIERRGSKFNCHYVVVDPRTSRVHFYSRIVGSRECS